MTVNIISDLHENHNIKGYSRFNPHLLAKADVIVVAGDIYTLGGNGLADGFIERFCNDFVSADGTKKFKHLIWVRGNHDYYTYDISDLSCIKDDVDKRNTITTIDGVSFLCTTLWTNITKNINMIHLSFPDYRMIPNLIINDSNRLFHENLEWLEENAKIEKEKGNKVVIVTHHCPHKKLIDPAFKNSKINECFTVIDRKFYGRVSAIKAKYWIHGHSHKYLNKQIGRTTYIRNPFGYLIKTPLGYMPEVTDFKYDCVIKV